MLTLIYMLHRVIFDQHRPLVCREIVHKVKETVKRNVHSKKKKESCSTISLRSVASRNKGLCRRHHIASGSTVPPPNHHSREAFESNASFSRGRYLTSSTKTHPRGGEEDGCSQHQRSCLLSRVLVVSLERHQGFERMQRLIGLCRLLTLSLLEAALAVA